MHVCTNIGEKQNLIYFQHKICQYYFQYHTYNGMNINSPIIVPATDLAVPERSLITATPMAIRIAVTFSASQGMKYRLLL